MIVCPICGNFTSEDICEVCGMRLSIDESYGKKKPKPGNEFNKGK